VIELIEDDLFLEEFDHFLVVVLNDLFLLAIKMRNEMKFS
jgi:hypothetical protein